MMMGLVWSFTCRVCTARNTIHDFQCQFKAETPSSQSQVNNSPKKKAIINSAIHSASIFAIPSSDPILSSIFPLARNTFLSSEPNNAPSPPNTQRADRPTEHHTTPRMKIKGPLAIVTTPRTLAGWLPAARDLPDGGVRRAWAPCPQCFGICCCVVRV
ncbi:hypothetical protein BU24DRAFT_185596 [Aaosphaeria arxii CBS 175.79]|uniref:Uncharacterized protein n=1 Tax=Aaosphaeria arxii CBS 175.79 TaxID=1450172 RepID=A0A6A5XUA4_9PLEO|nr:uncharacterized protein BU24DRAFT_185596 [Aaosphaeria arxii CBS 175.79]KAF2015824.1 hypothetical protein BU24DRAFT_185596 [Aaosphaeria arxii CBS 175.79]